ncbi:protein kinase/ LuxR family transcriptional regulator [Nocardia nova SH22a]|uniref:Protein kinase/ LuxR family transcriptional regulator n=1 Tax=Nocardia nova SH22a TaxID=1415166 RepID=W5THI0_9NOCA|nr:protein kinase [Nocardia nova]AHH18428.1 protein kinase/ LuxR family transcriptional regulator [Nocardia nova SH22a]
MGEIEADRTQRDVMSMVSAELADAGFTDAHEVGSGGFGLVFRCTQTDLDRTVAVKVLTATSEQDNTQRFVREQQAMGRLTGHPNVADILQVGVTATGMPYLVMPYYRHGSLDSLLRQQGPLPAREVLRVGVKIAGVLETAHGMGILHRDVKPGNILITDYGEPVLTDFGIARVAHGFRTTTGAIAGSPAFVAPEVLSGEQPTPAVDVYALGATLFAALTGHAAFERHTGEQVVAQFLRITSQAAPDLREHGIPADISQVIEQAMARMPEDRPSAAAFGDALRQAQARHDWAVDEMATPPASGTHGPGNRFLLGSPGIDNAPAATGNGSARGATLPVELTSFIGRRTEVAEAKALLANRRLLTLTGIGGAGKTRLALRVAAAVERGMADGVRVVWLGELRDGALLPAEIAAAMGLTSRERPILDALIDFLAPRELLVVLDNCEQIIDEAAKVVAALLGACPRLRILATSREVLGVDGEAVLWLPPLSVPDRDRRLSLRTAHRYDALGLFADRAATAVPDFALTDDNVATVSEICRQLDGLPLAIELAAARLRTLSPDQILRRLADRFALLTRGSRTAPSRQQTLRLCVDWSYSLCTSAEQAVWRHLSVFAGSFEIDAAEDLCVGELGAEQLLDILSGLVDKSIVLREDTGASVRFCLLETVRDYGRDKLTESGHHLELRRRHRDWYRQLAAAFEADWSSPRQLDWIDRLDREQPNLREALQFSVADDAEPSAGLAMATSLQLFWFARGQLGEARYWLGRALAISQGASTALRAKALQGAIVAADVQGDSDGAAGLVAETRTLTDRATDPTAYPFANLALGLHAVFGGESARAIGLLETCLAGFAAQHDDYGQVVTFLALGWVYQSQGDSRAALVHHRKALASAEAHGDLINQESALWALAVVSSQEGDRNGAVEMLRKALRLSRGKQVPLLAASALETLAWIACSDGDMRRAAVLMGASAALSSLPGTAPMLLPKLAVHHERTELLVKRALGTRRFDTAFSEGRAMDQDAAIAFALDDSPSRVSAPTNTPGELTKREYQVASLVAEGLTNKAIAARLVISQRTVDGHVEHILTKLEFTSRAQIAAWVAERGTPTG